MSASGYKRTYSGQLANVCFTPKSRHSDSGNRQDSKKQTLDVRLAPESGRKLVCHGMSAFDPKRTLPLLGASGATSWPCLWMGALPLRKMLGSRIIVSQTYLLFNPVC